MLNTEMFIPGISDYTYFKLSTPYSLLSKTIYYYLNAIYTYSISI